MVSMKGSYECITKRKIQNRQNSKTKNRTKKNSGIHKLQSEQCASLFFWIFFLTQKLIKVTKYQKLRIAQKISFVQKISDRSIPIYLANLATYKKRCIASLVLHSTKHVAGLIEKTSHSTCAVMSQHMCCFVPHVLLWPSNITTIWYQVVLGGPSIVRVKRVSYLFT